MSEIKIGTLIFENDRNSSNSLYMNGFYIIVGEEFKYDIDKWIIFSTNVGYEHYGKESMNEHIDEGLLSVMDE